MGFLGVGIKAAGLEPVAGCDVNAVFADKYEAHQGLPTVVGDVTSTETVAKLWRKCPHKVGIAAGVSCQPYSRLGDRRSGPDIRSTSLTGTLELIHWLQ